MVLKTIATLSNALKHSLAICGIESDDWKLEALMFPQMRHGRDVKEKWEKDRTIKF